MPRSSFALLRLISFSALGLALSLALSPASPSVAQPLPAAGTVPIPPGEARVWFYRTFFPDDTGDMPAVAMNGQLVGYARSGWSFYRDVPAGPYHVTVASIGQDVNQAKDVVLTPGEQLYLSIQSSPSWEQNFRGYRRGTYYVWFEPPQIAAIHFSQTRLGNGS
ncbi:MAG TPA: hypothetical protein VET89_02585 [Stellaceae bacterium]|nr:hypothetical protein [Stellaceae bacterium]